MDEPTRIPAPNYTQIPNAIFDLMADKDAGLTEAELRVILAIARKTFGWHKRRDKISLTQLVKMTAMGRASVVSGITAAIRRGIVRRTPDAADGRGGFFYELVVTDADQFEEVTSSKFELVQNPNQSNNCTRTSSNFEPELVRNLNPQKKDKEKKERGGEREDSPARSPAISAYFEILPGHSLTGTQVQKINETVTDLKRWRKTLEEWSLNGWDARRIGKILDRYQSGRTMQDERPAGTNGTRADPHERPPLPVIPPARDLPNSQEAARKLAAMLKEQRHD